MAAIKWLNEFFFAQEKISWHDAGWFYGVIIVWLIITLFIVL